MLIDINIFMKSNNHNLAQFSTNIVTIEFQDLRNGSQPGITASICNVSTGKTATLGDPKYKMNREPGCYIPHPAGKTKPNNTL